MKNQLSEDAARILEADPDFRVLRRLKLPPMPPVESWEGVRHGVIVDCETTGLDANVHDVVELGILPFMFRTGGDRPPEFVHFFSPSRMLNEPSQPIPPAMSQIHGLTDEDVRGHRFNLGDIDAEVREVAIVIAHNAAFDRPFLEKVSPVFREKPWACSMEQAPWKANGYSSASLENICTKQGAFYDAHHATNDCEAVAFALMHQVGGKTGLQHVIEATKRKSWHVFAHDAPIALKDRLKARGYKWADGSEPGRPKCWHKEIAEDLAGEQEWLDVNIYAGFRLVPYEVRDVTARDRFTVRG
jgi:DNA polymerase-3 subunit epsilon